MKILIVTHDKEHYRDRSRRMRWSWLPYYFERLGHEVEYITKQRWPWYPLIYVRFRPDTVIGVGKTGALITALHHKLRPRARFVFDLNDHPHFYRSEQRMQFLIKNHDIVTTPSHHYHQRYRCHALVMNGSNFTPKKAKKAYDIIYIGQTHSIYNISAVQEACKASGISLRVISTLSLAETEQEIAKAALCLYPLSWDASAKMTDYAAMGKAVVAIRPNLAEEISYPAHYTLDVITGIKSMLHDNGQRKALEKQARAWFLRHAGTWERQAERYLAAVGAISF